MEYVLCDILTDNFPRQLLQNAETAKEIQQKQLLARCFIFSYRRANATIVVSRHISLWNHSFRMMYTLVYLIFASCLFRSWLRSAPECISFGMNDSTMILGG